MNSSFSDNLRDFSVMQKGEYIYIQLVICVSLFLKIGLDHHTRADLKMEYSTEKFNCLTSLLS